MARLSQAQKIKTLTMWLFLATENEDLFIITDQILGKTFAIAERTGDTYLVKTNFMTFNEMDCYFFGVLDAKWKKINF